MKAGTALAQHGPSSARLERIGVQLYTVRELMRENVERTLASVASIGYREVEFAGLFGLPAKNIRRILDVNGLKAPSSHVGISDISEKLDETLSDANTLGIRYVTLSWIDEQDRTLDGYARVAEKLNLAGERARAAGMQLAFHNHTYGFAPIGTTVPYDYLLRTCTPENLAMEADVFWMRQAGQYPLDWFRKYPGRFHMLHVKDMGPPPANAMLDVGDGVIGWRELLSHRTSAGLRHVFVEHDEPNDPLASLRRSYRYLKALRFDG